MLRCLVFKVMTTFKGLLLVLVLFLAVVEIKGIETFPNKNDGLSFNKPSSHFPEERSARSATTNQCQATENITYEANTTESSVVLCACGSDKSEVLWMNSDCKEITDGEFTGSLKRGYVVQPPTVKDAQVVFYCFSGDCVQKVTIVLVEGQESGMSSGLRGFLIFVVIAVLLVTTLFVVSKYKSQVYLGFRDTCAPSGDNDGLEFDAYVSIGKNEGDRKLLERVVTDVLKKEHGYRFFIDDENLLPRLDYSQRVQDKMHRSHVLVVMFTATYMTNDWCMYCFTEGLRKLLELNKPMVFLVCDLTIQRELNSVGSLVDHVPKIFLPLVQTEKEKQKTLRQIRTYLPAPRRHGGKSRDMRAPILSDVEDIDSHSLRSDKESYGGTATKYTFNKTTVQNHHDDLTMEEMEVEDDAELVFDEGEDPRNIAVKQYNARPDFYTITAGTDQA